MKWAVVVVLVLAGLGAAGCGDDDEGGGARVRLVVDEAVPVSPASIPTLDGLGDEPLAAVMDASGLSAPFVENQLLVVTDDDAELQAIVDRWGGEVLASYVPADRGLEGLPAMHVVRVASAQPDTAKLGDDLASLAPDVDSDLRVSSERGLATLAVAAREGAAGHVVGINWVAAGDGFYERVTADSPTGPDGDGAYTPNAFDWPYMRTGGALDVGVGDAWRALELAGRLEPTIPVAVIDGGFVAPHPDFPAGTIYPSGIPFLLDSSNVQNTMACGGQPCPWHGTGCVLTAMGVPDNGVGAAGPGGPVAQPMAINSLGDMFTFSIALGEAHLLGARVISMSITVPVPAAFNFTVVPLDAHMRAMRLLGVLMFAAAGNNGRATDPTEADVDREDCFANICWESSWWYPCENGGVLCVGAAQFDNPAKADYSNWAHQTEGETIDLFAPGTEYVARLPDDPSTANVGLFNGTSAATPFTAGIAALVWAADPSASADQVERLLLDNLRPSTDPLVQPGTVDAYAAAIGALGGPPDEPPTIEITGPLDGANVDYGVPTTFVAAVDDLEDGTGCCEITWTSDVDGAIGTGSSPSFTFPGPGDRVITARAVDPDGVARTDTVAVHVVNTAPVATIGSPRPDAQLFAGSAVQLRGLGSDRNDGGAIACEALTWSSSSLDDAGTFPVVGCEPLVVFPTTGPRTLTLTAVDALGLPGSTTVDVSVVTPPVDPPPTGSVVLPANGTEFLDNQTDIHLQGTASDPEGQALTETWYADWGNGPTQIGADTLDFVWRPLDSGVLCDLINRVVSIWFDLSDGTTTTSSDTVQITLQCPPG